MPAAGWRGWRRRSSSRRCRARSTRLCFTIDGTFPTHEANPLIEENRRDIVARVTATRAEIGIAWDGDADRCFFIDEDGEFIPGDFVTALLAEAFLLKEPGATIVYDLRASYAVKDVAAKYGGTAVMNRVGHAFFKGRMRELNAVFGGEVTGHYYFRDNFYCDNGFIPALLILELMSKKQQSLKQLLEPLRAKYFISGEINTKMPSMEAMSARMAAIEARYPDAKISKLDGISIEYPDWHFNVRPSNTEPLLRLNLEGTTSDADGAQARRSAVDYPQSLIRVSVVSRRAITPQREEAIMIVIRNVFRLKFGKAREAVALIKEGLAIQKRVMAGQEFSTRVLTDVTGPFYTLVLEITAPNLATFESNAPRIFGDKEWQANYQKVGALVESGYREVFTIVE